MLNVGVIGAGYIADLHINALQEIPDLEILIICDTNLSKAQALAKKYGIPHSVANVKALFNKKIEVAHVLLPPALHYEIGKLLIEGGIHVFFEKPMCTTASECEELMQLASEKGVLLGVNHNFLFSSIYEELVADLDSHKLGPISHIEIVWNKEIQPVTSAPFNKWLFADPKNILLERIL